MTAPYRTRAGSRGRPAWLIATMAVVGTSSPVAAQVIEIGNDGVATTFAGPTRFVTAASEPLGLAAPVRAARPPATDSYDVAASRHKVDAALLRAVAWRESRGDNRAISPKGALGTMQLMPATARALGVDPSDEAANIAGGAAYLAQQLSRFAGSVPLALAAYNAGPGAVLRYGGIPPYAETQAYVAAIMQRWRGPALASATPIARHVAATPKPAYVQYLMIEVPTP